MIRTSVFNLRSYCPKRIGEICSQTILQLDDTTKKVIFQSSIRGYEMKGHHPLLVPSVDEFNHSNRELNC